MKNIKKKVLFGVVSLLPGIVIAGNGFGKVRIEHVGGYGESLVFFYTTTYNLEQGTCNTNPRWVLDLNSVAGKEQYSLLLAAQLSDKDVVVKGTGTCNYWSGSEDVHNVGFPMN